MAHIVQFRASAARDDLECESRQSTDAQIIIFPGVRRERHADSDARKGSKARVERDRLELPD